MPAILKILTGPQEGAESILRPGKAYTIGCALECDISLIDAMMAPQQARLTLREDGKLNLEALASGCYVDETVVSEGKSGTVGNFQVITLGGTRLCMGPADGETWPQLTWKELSALHEAEAAAAQAAENSAETESQAAEITAEEAEEAEARAAAKAEEEAKARAARRRMMAHILWGVVIFFVGFASLFVAGFFWSSTKPYVVDYDAIDRQNQERLLRMVERYSLQYDQIKNTISGNFANAADRREVESFIYSELPDLKLDFTDDETMLASLKNLLFGMEGETVVVKSLKNCEASVYGVTATPKRWQEVKERIYADIPNLRKLDADVLYVDEVLVRMRNVLRLYPQFSHVAVSWKNRQFVFEGVIHESYRQLFLDTISEIGKFLPKNIQLVNAVKCRTEVIAPSKDAGPVSVIDGSLPPLPICGIIFQPFTCIQMSDGSKVTEGGMIGDLVVEKITPDEVHFKQGGKVHVWRP